MPVVSLCVKEGGWLRIEIMGGTWVGDVHDVGAGGCCHRQDLEMVWPLRLLAKQEQGCVKTIFGYVLRGCTNAQDWEKRKEKTEKKNEKQKRERKKMKRTLTVSLYISFMALAVQCWQSLVGRRAWSVACQPQAVHRSHGGTCKQCTRCGCKWSSLSRPHDGMAT